MPKFSVYVPEDLWERVRRELGEINVSHATQRGLRAMLTERTIATRTALGLQPDPERMERIVSRLRGTSQGQFAEGYEFGLVLAERLDLEQLSELKHDQAEWVFGQFEDLHVRATWESWGEVWASIYDVLAPAAAEGLGPNWGSRLTTNGKFSHGIVAALEDVWTHLHDESSVTGE